MKVSQLVLRILKKKARGYTVKEVTDEYIVVDGELTANKRKVVTKQIAPDLNAVKALLEIDTMGQLDLSSMSEEQLMQERERLLATLKLCDNNEKSNKEEIDAN